MARKREEESHQKAFFQWLSLNHPTAYALTWHCPNGGKRNAIEGAKFKEMGVKPGVPDVFMAVPIHPYHGLFIEFKAGKNKLTPYQETMMSSLSKEKYRVELCYSVDDAIEVVKAYLAWRLFF
jgi:hypothetical protein